MKDVETRVFNRLKGESLGVPNETSRVPMKLGQVTASNIYPDLDFTTSRGKVQSYSLIAIYFMYVELCIYIYTYRMYNI